MDFSVPLNQLTERARTVDEPAWVDAVRWLKSAAHLLKNQIFPTTAAACRPTCKTPSTRPRCACSDSLKRSA